MKHNLGYDGRSNSIQAFPLQKGLIALTGGDHYDIAMAHCVSDGTLTLHYDGGSSEPLNMLQGDDFVLPHETVYVTIVAGTFHLA